ncbi:MAG: hypothetical protein ACO4AI_06055 [Prochlorothrix sp.]
MPHMDGYAATQRIRSLEQQRQGGSSNPGFDLESAPAPPVKPVQPQAQALADPPTALQLTPRPGTVPADTGPAKDNTGQRSSVPIVALSASVFGEAQEEMRSVGCDAIMTKPFDAKDLYTTLEKLLGIQFNITEVEQSQSAPSTLDASNNPALSVQTPSAFHPEDLDLLPLDWKKELYDHAACLSEQDCLTLLDDLPEGHETVRHYFTDLVHDFRFDVLLELLEQSLGDAIPSET